NLDPHTVATWANRTSQTLILDKHTRLPVKNLYKTPETLGMDRLAGVCGAVQLFPGFNSLVIDVGTCVTYDFVDRQLQFHGGGISPGLNMRFEAVHTFTASLPLVSPAASAKSVRDTTAPCIQSRVRHGMLAEIDTVIRC